MATHHHKHTANTPTALYRIEQTGSTFCLRETKMSTVIRSGFTSQADAKTYAERFGFHLEQKEGK